MEINYTQQEKRVARSWYVGAVVFSAFAVFLIVL